MTVSAVLSLVLPPAACRPRLRDMFEQINFDFDFDLTLAVVG